MRTTTAKGQFRKKRSDSLVGTLEETYKVNFGVRGDMKLSTYLKENGLPSLAKALEKVRQ